MRGDNHRSLGISIVPPRYHIELRKERIKYRSRIYGNAEFLISLQFCRINRYRYSVTRGMFQHIFRYRIFVRFGLRISGLPARSHCRINNDR